MNGVTIMKAIMIGFAALLCVSASFACGDSAPNGTNGTGGPGGAGGTGGTGGGPPASVLGTKHMGNCDTADDFAAACEAEGGVLGDNCRWVDCLDKGLLATCFDPQPPGPNEFSCEGLINCQVGEVCRFKKPTGDGCFVHECIPLPSECAADPTCTCVTNALTPEECTTDAEGNMTITLTALG